MIECLTDYSGRTIQNDFLEPLSKPVGPTAFPIRRINTPKSICKSCKDIEVAEGIRLV